MAVAREGGRSIHSIGRVFFVKAPPDSRPHEVVEDVLRREGVRAAWIHGIGGFRWARLAVFSPEERRYYPEDFEARPGRVIEVLSLTGNSVASPQGVYYTHLHAVAALEPGRVVGGHLIDAAVEPFLELVVVELVGGYEEIAALLSHRWSPG